MTSTPQRLLEGVIRDLPLAGAHWLEQRGSARSGWSPRTSSAPGRSRSVGLPPDLAAGRRGARARRGRGQRRQSRAGRRRGRPAARRAGHGLHARGRDDPQGAGDPGYGADVRFHGDTIDQALEAAGVLAGDGGGAHPPVRPPRRDRRPGHRRPRDHGQDARGPHRGGVHRRRRPAGRRRARGEVARPDRPRRRRAGARPPRPTRRRSLPGHRSGSSRWRRWPTASPSDVRATRRSPSSSSTSTRS